MKSTLGGMFWLSGARHVFHLFRYPAPVRGELEFPALWAGDDGMEGVDPR